MFSLLHPFLGTDQDDVCFCLRDRYSTEQSPLKPRAVDTHPRCNTWGREEGWLGEGEAAKASGDASREEILQTELREICGSSPWKYPQSNQDL